MTSIEDTQTEVTQLLKAKLPKADVARVDVTDTIDSDGEPSLNIWIVFKARPPKSDMRQAKAIVDELRTWLANHGDERFPYFSFVTEQDEKELSAIN
jgi:hypothetical protein